MTLHDGLLATLADVAVTLGGEFLLDCVLFGERVFNLVCHLSPQRQDIRGRAIIARKIDVLGTKMFLKFVKITGICPLKLKNRLVIISDCHNRRTFNSVGQKVNQLRL